MLQDWFVLNFCQLGFIGKMFKSTELPILIQFLVMFYNYKPGDQLLDHIAETQMCRLEDRVRCSLTSWLDYRSFVFLYQALRHLLLGI